MRVRLAGLLLVLAVGGGSGASAASAPEVTSGPAAAVTVCKSGYRHAIIGGRHMCLKAGQACKRSFDRTYHRYGFHCHSGRLTRRAAPPSPRGTFVFTRIGDIYVGNADGSGQTRITNTVEPELWPRWFADGKRITFTRKREIFVVNVDGTGERRITTTSSEGTTEDWGSDPSPDGRELAVERRSVPRPGVPERIVLAVVGVDGGQVRMLYAPSSFLAVGEPDWSPDGTKIAFAAHRTDGSADVYAMNADGTGRTQLIDSAGDDGNPRWSPDGRRITFQSDRNGGCIFVMNADGSGVRRLTTGCRVGVRTTWSPDRKQIAWADQDGRAFAINADGTGRVHLRGLGSVESLDWRPTSP